MKNIYYNIYSKLNRYIKICILIYLKKKIENSNTYNRKIIKDTDAEKKPDYGSSFGKEATHTDVYRDTVLMMFYLKSSVGAD